MQWFSRKIPPVRHVGGRKKSKTPPQQNARQKSRRPPIPPGPEGRDDEPYRANPRQLLPFPFKRIADRPLSCQAEFSAVSSPIASRRRICYTYSDIVSAEAAATRTFTGTLRHIRERGRVFGGLFPIACPSTADPPEKPVLSRHTAFFRTHYLQNVSPERRLP